VALTPTNRLIAQAKALEANGQLEGAAKGYADAGDFAEAARVLVALRRFEDAGNLLIRGLGVPPDQVGALTTQKRKEAFTAAICFSRTENYSLAVTLFVALGEHPRAVELLEKKGDIQGAIRVRESALNPTALLQVGKGGRATTSGGGHSTSVRLQRARSLEESGNLQEAMQAYVQLKQLGHAARVAQLLSLHDKAANYYLDAGMPFEAAVCYHNLGDVGRCLDTLIRVPRDDARYRQAAVQAIGMASDLSTLDFRLEQFLTRYLDEGPRDANDLEAMYKLARLYQRHDYPDNAAETYDKIVARDPAFRDAQQQLENIRRERQEGARVYERVMREDMAFEGRDHTPGPVDELPGLPDLPPLPSGAPAGGATQFQQGPPPAMGPGGNITQLAAPGGPQRPLPKGREAVARTTMGGGQHWTAAPQHPPQSSLHQPMGQPPQFAPPQFPQAPMQPPQFPQTPPPGVHPANVSAHMAPTEQVPEQDMYRQQRPAQVHGTAGAPAQAATGAPAQAAVVPTPASPGADAKPEGAGFQVGSKIAGRYHIEKKIGKGGMAVVYKARDEDLDIDIALKVFNQPIEDDEQLLHRFKQELIVSRKLSHHNIITLYDIGIEGGFRYITMELLQGFELKTKLGQPMDFMVGVDYLMQACHGLQFAHDKGIVHRDVKPQNFFVTNDEVLKVMDFGIAKQQATAGVTVAGMIAGTPNYMSPEQINGFSTVTSSTDIYALGVIAYEMFTGSVPFSHPELMPLLMMHLTQPPESPRARNPVIPEALERVILTLMAKDPAQRYPSCKALAEDLEKLRRSV